jgi:hypothetical protein
VSGSSALPNSNAILELESANKGLLLPRVALTARNLSSPLSGHTAGMLVYNTANGGSGADTVSPGYYYNNGSKWIRLADASAPSDSTNDAWVNDNDNTQVLLATQSDGATARAAGTEFVVKNNGNVGIGTTDPTRTMDVNGQLRIRNLPVADTADANVLIPGNTSGDITKTTVRKFLHTTGILVYSSPNNFWSGLDMGTKSAKLTFVGRTAAGGDFSFEVFWGVNTGFTVIPNSLVNASSFSTSGSTFSMTVGGAETITFTFATAAVPDRRNVHTSGSDWVQGSFFVIKHST